MVRQIFFIIDLYTLQGQKNQEIKLGNQTNQEMNCKNTAVKKIKSYLRHGDQLHLRRDNIFPQVQPQWT